ncbi:MAG: hypothetical protein IID44_23335 [Planctomycetes bacterium]|nr:hypothetical protein [Planctomycetota bacterium]
MNTVPISETVSIRSLGFDEIWLQDQIWENPSCLGLGELEGVSKERAVSSGGRLDVLLKNPVDDSMYEVEVMLGDTDPSHIVRTIEYWDLIKRKWPQRQHFAVLVAERITKRFFNVIQILSGAVPLIAIQANIIKSVHGSSLHFTKILDVYEEPDDDTNPDDGTYDEAYWAKRSQETLDAAKYLQHVTSEVYVDSTIRFNKDTISIAVASHRQLTFRKRSGANVLVQFCYGTKQEEIQNVLDENGVQYNDKNRHFHCLIGANRIEDLKEMFVRIAELNKNWWNSQ